MVFAGFPALPWVVVLFFGGLELAHEPVKFCLVLERLKTSGAALFFLAFMIRYR